MGDDAVICSRVCARTVLFLTRSTSSRYLILITNKYGGQRALSKRRNPVDSATQIMVAYDVYAGKAFVDLSEEELGIGLTKIAAVDVQLTSIEDFTDSYSVC